MGARAFSHSGFRCGRRGARSIWTSSTELAIRILDVNLYCTMRGRPFAGEGTEVTFQPGELALNFSFRGLVLWVKTCANSFDGWRHCMRRWGTGLRLRPLRCLPGPEFPIPPSCDSWPIVAHRSLSS